MMDVQQQLFGLMALAEEHQKALQVVLEGLAAERAALARERAAVAQAAASVAGGASEVKKAAAAVVPAIQEATGGVVGDAVRGCLAGASKVAATALNEACRPIVGQLSGVVWAAGEAEGKLSRAVAAFGWKWATVAGGAAAGGIVAVLLAGWFSVWWQRYQVESLIEGRLALTAEVAQLQANADQWAKKAPRAKLEKCGEAGRLCVRVDTSKAYGKDGDYMVIRGY